MSPIKPYTVRPIRGRHIVDGPGSDGIPLATRGQAEAIANLMNVAYEEGVEREPIRPRCTANQHAFIPLALAAFRFKGLEYSVFGCDRCGKVEMVEASEDE